MFFSKNREEKGKNIVAEANKTLENCKKYSDAANSAVTAADFFSNYDKLINELEYLCKFRKYNIFPKNHPPKADLKRTKITKQNQINIFIRRSYAELKQKYFAADEDKRESLKKEYFDSLKKYFCQMDKFNKNAVLELEKMEISDRKTE